MQITSDIFYIGVNDHDIDLFEGQYIVPNGMAYNSYLVKDEKTMVIDTVDTRFVSTWLDSIAAITGNQVPDYLLVQHMEPDHAAGIDTFLKTYPQATVIASLKAFDMMNPADD